MVVVALCLGCVTFYLFFSVNANSFPSCLQVCPYRVCVCGHLHWGSHITILHIHVHVGYLLPIAMCSPCKHKCLVHPGAGCAPPYLVALVNFLKVPSNNERKKGPTGHLRKYINVSRICARRSCFSKQKRLKLWYMSIRIVLFPIFAVIGEAVDLTTNRCFRNIH